MFNLRAYCEIIISEILANEPSNRVYLEWFEIYNDGDLPVDLHDYTVTETGSELDIPEGCIIKPNAYAVFCRRLEPVDGGDCFEYRWGDSSGVWGDSPDENYAAYQVAMTLSNGNGSLYVMHNDLSGVDHYIWESSSDDARSVERDDVTDIFSGWHDCYDTSLSTPGRENSQLPADDSKYFLNVAPDVVSLKAINPIYTFTYGVPSGTDVSMYIYDDSSRKHAILIEDSEEAVKQVTWDLTDDDNKKLPPGLYFLLFRTSGEISVNKTVPIVIAP